MRWHGLHIAATCVAVLLLGGCDAAFFGAGMSRVKPEARPDTLSVQKGPSAASRAMHAYYQRVQEDLLAQGLLRTDGGGPDTPFTDTTLTRNFERIALIEEYARGGGLRPSSGSLEQIKKWVGPVRINAVFGDSVDKAQRQRDGEVLAAYSARLARITGHPISYGSSRPNFFVLIMGEDDKAQLNDVLQRVAPTMEPSSRSVFLNLPRSIHCLVVAFSDSATGDEYMQAVALVPAEHPDLMRLACFHEELAQGLGLANDDPNARPSIFNDDEEFALLTTHDEMLLKILYDPRLRPGMTAEEARPIIAEKASQLVGSAGQG